MNDYTTITENLTGIASAFPALCFIEEGEQSPALPDFYNVDTLDYVADGNYRFTQVNGTKLLLCNASVCAAGDDAEELANELGPWKAIPKYYRCHKEELHTFADRMAVEYYDRCEQTIIFAAWARNHLSAAQMEIASYNRRHPNRKLNLDKIARAEKRALDRLYGEDIEPLGDTAMGRNKPMAIPSE